MRQFQKNNFSRRLIIWSFCLFFITAACLVPDFTGHAKTKTEDTGKTPELKIKNPKNTVYLCSSDIGTITAETHIDIPVRCNSSNRIFSDDVHSDNELVTGKVKVYVDEFDIYDCFLCIGTRYPGRANLLLEDQSGRAYTVTLDVLPYENPIKSLSITNVEGGKNIAGILEKTHHPRKDLFFSEKSAEPKLKVKAAKDWVITSIATEVVRSKGGYFRVDADKVNTQSKTLKLKKVAKGDNFDISIDLKNRKNGAEQYITIYE